MEAFLELEMLTTAFVVTYVRLHQGGSRGGISRDSIPEKLRSSLNGLNGTTHRCAGPSQRAQCLLFKLRIFVVSPSGSIWRSSLKSTDLPWLPASQRAFWSPPFAHAARTAYPARGCELATVGAGPDDRRFVIRKDSGHRYEIADLAVDHADQGADRRLVEAMRHIFTFLEQRDVTAAQTVAGSPKGGGALAAAESAGQSLANECAGGAARRGRRRAWSWRALDLKLRNQRESDHEEATSVACDLKSGRPSVSCRS